MIVVEGPDGAGKTSLVKHICDELHMHPGVRSIGDRKLLYQRTVADSYNGVIDAVRGRTRPVVWDRFFYSDLVYAPIVRNEISRFTPAQQVHLINFVKFLGCPVILCMPPLSYMMANVKANQADQISGVLEKTPRLRTAYENLLAEGVFPDDTIVYDYTRAWAQTHRLQIVDKCKAYTELRKEREW